MSDKLNEFQISNKNCNVAIKEGEREILFQINWGRNGGIYQLGEATVSTENNIDGVAILPNGSYQYRKNIKDLDFTTGLFRVSPGQVLVLRNVNGEQLLMEIISIDKEQDIVVFKYNLLQPEKEETAQKDVKSKKNPSMDYSYYRGTDITYRFSDSLSCFPKENNRICGGSLSDVTKRSETT